MQVMVVKNITKHQQVQEALQIETLAVEASERNTAQEALQTSEAQFRAIFERSTIGIGLIDMKAKIVDVNPALSQMLGYTCQELCGKRFIDYISHQRGDLALYRQLISGIQVDAKQLLTRHRVEIERRLLHKDGGLVWTRLSVSIIPGCNNQPEFFLAMVEDITERKQTELKLRTSQAAAEAGSRAKSEFLATMSHELRTPLNAIMGLSQLLQQEIVGSLNEKQKEYISCIYGSGEHLLAVINDILDLSKVEAGKEELSFIPLSVPELCGYVLSTVRDRAVEKGLLLDSKIDPKAEICMADARRIKQMLVNLLSNAVKFTPSGRVSLEVKKVPEGINFIVSDTGIGIDSNQFQFLFEPFKQLDSRLNRQYEGTGLGLALTRKLARLHGGDVTFVSTLGEGSEFTLFLPNRVDSKDEEDKAVISSSISTTKKRILLVEQEENTGIFLQDYLEIIGYQVDWLKNGNSFLEKVRTLKPDLIFLDGDLAGNISSWNLLKQLKEKPKLQNLPVVITSANQPDLQELSSLQISANEYLLKPIRIAKLEKMLKQYLK
ncbi:PAS domain S-box protein [Nostocaceae cyanobacterium CENA369]|uniref:Circadian input-output histidine kinase CikA n=1 Tax=Dendronalium phyllosphericum CENA369 TaxID=1725256 RepID=A0A8J7HYA9_9NOST|nr:PAS domain S-box protein [Dendronalium phyllosphericum CENA369]